MASVVLVFLVSGCASGLSSGLRAQREPKSTRILDRNGKLLFEVVDPKYGSHRRVDVRDLPRHVINAFLAAEDPGFYRNPGFDLKGIIRSLFANLRAGRIVSGGSSITQQLVRNKYIDAKEAQAKAYSRKLKEILFAFLLTLTRSKDEILSEYLSSVFFGNNAWGLEAAAQTYFGKSSSDLDLAEASLLASIPRGPSVLNPLADYKSLISRQKTVLRLMQRHGFATPEDVAAAQAEALDIRVHGFVMEAPHFVMYVVEELQDMLGSQELYLLGLDVYTTLDLDLQHEAEKICRDRVGMMKGHNVSNAAALVLDARSGEVLAYVGSVDYFNEEIDGAVDMVRTPRQPGSAIKPLVYAVAFEKGMSPSTVIVDEETTFRTRAGRPYIPRNFDGRHHGLVTAREALANSYNVPAVKILSEIGVQSFVEKARLFGLDELWERSGQLDLSVALGGCEVSLLHLTSAYQALANSGKRTGPQVIRKIVGEDGTLYKDRKGETEVFAQSRGHWELGRAISFLVTDILSDDHARSKQFGEMSVLYPGLSAAVKTGTTTEHRDNWTIGYTPRVVVGVWVGNADNSPMKDVTGASGAAPIWSKLIQVASKGHAEERFAIPNNVVRLRICRSTGLLASDACRQTLDDFFIEGMAPLMRCSECESVHSDRLGEGISPLKVLSPQDGSVYVIDADVPLKHQQVELRAAVAGSGSRLAWYVDGKEIKRESVEVQGIYSALWQIWPGEHIVSFVLELPGGATFSRQARVKVVGPN